MKKILRLAEEIIPLSSRQGFFLLLIISCFFQFVLFYSPALAEDAVKNYNNLANSNDKDFSLISPESEFIISMKSSKEPALNLDISALITKTVTLLFPSEIPDYQKEAYLNNKIEDLEIENSDLKNNSESKKVALALEPDIKSLEPEIRVISSSVHSMTAYNSEVGQTDDSPCITANGFDVCEHGIEDTVAANFLPFGTKVRIPDLFGDRIFVVRDRMNRRYTDRVDIWMLERSDAIQFGVRRTRIEVVEIIEPEIKVPSEPKIKSVISRI